MGVLEYIRNVLMGVFEYVITEMGKILKSFPICQIGVLEYINILWFLHIPGLPDVDLTPKWELSNTEGGFRAIQKGVFEYGYSNINKSVVK